MNSSGEPNAPRSPSRSFGWESKSILRSFEFAWDGLSFCFSTQRHMRFHFAIMALTLVAAWGLRVTQSELLHILLAMILVLISEMVNTAIENAIDLATDSYDERAKVAKDVAAGAVLLAAFYSIVVAVLIFAGNDRLRQIIERVPAGFPEPHVGTVQLCVMGVILLGVFITWVKKMTNRGTLWRGGAISGHAAFGFLIATVIAMATHDLAVTCLALALALLVAQSRIQARIHSPSEVLIGGLLGIVMAIVLFWWPG